MVADQDTLIARLLDGDDDAADCLVSTYRPRLSSAVRRILAADGDVDDVVQETFFYALRALPGFRRDSQLATWLLRIAINRSLMRLRTRRRRSEVSLEGAPSLRDALPWKGHSPESAAIDAESSSKLRQAIGRLPDQQRAALEHVYLDEASVIDAAAAIGVSRNALKLRAHRGRRALRTMLAEVGVTSGAARC
ncbi:MAG: RNA polymerase sigma factor [Vicinamibacterales bacterium]